MRHTLQRHSRHVYVSHIQPLSMLLLIIIMTVLQCNYKFFFSIGACVDFYLGMGSGTIPDSNINASSVQSASTPAKNGRLNYTSGSSWCAGTSDTNPYLQIDLQTLHIICAVSTQGNSQADQWVKTYTLQLSTDGITWTNYTELGAQAKVCYSCTWAG